MSELVPSIFQDCCTPAPCCDPVVTTVPGPQGPAGEDGTDGTDGENAFTLLDGGFTMPAEQTNVTTTLIDNSWIGVDQVLYIQSAGYMQAVSVSGDGVSVTLKNLADTATGAYPDNAAPAVAIPDQAKVSPGGVQGPAGTAPTDALIKTNNLSDVTNTATARTNLGITLGPGAAGVPINDGALTAGQAVFATAVGIATKTDIAAFDTLSPLTTKGDLLTHDGTNNIRRAVGASANMVPLSDGAGDWAWALLSSVLGAATSILSYEVAANTDGQAIIYDAWTALNLNSLSDAAGNVISLIANQFVLKPGTYIALGLFTPQQAYARSSIFNITAGPPSICRGIQVRAMNNSMVALPLVGLFTVAAAQTLEWQYYMQNDMGGAGLNLGWPMNAGGLTEIYQSLTLLKIG